MRNFFVLLLTSSVSFGFLASALECRAPVKKTEDPSHRADRFAQEIKEKDNDEVRIQAAMGLADFGPKAEPALADLLGGLAIQERRPAAERGDRAGEDRQAGGGPRRQVARSCGPGYAVLCHLDDRLDWPGCQGNGADDDQGHVRQERRRAPQGCLRPGTPWWRSGQDAGGSGRGVQGRKRRGASSRRRGPGEIRQSGGAEPDRIVERRQYQGTTAGSPVPG